MGYIINELYRFRMLVIGIYIGIAVSSTYAFSLFTELMKRKYGFSQRDITTISTVGNCFGYLSFFAGMLFDYAGPKAVLLVAGFLGFFGYLLVGLAFDDVIADQGSNMANVVIFSVFNAILYLGCASLDVATVMPLMLNFPLDRGFIVIIQKTFAGLGTSVIATYFTGFFRNMQADESPGSYTDATLYSNYIYFVASQTFLCALLGMIFIDLPPYFMCQYRAARVSYEEKSARAMTLSSYMSQQAPRRRLYIGCGLVGVCLTYLTLTSIVTAYNVPPTEKSVFTGIAIGVIFLLALFALMALPLQFLGRYVPVVRVHERFKELGYAKEHNLDNCAVEPESVYEEAGEGALEPRKPENEAVVGTAKADDKSSVGDPQYQGSFWSHLLTVDLWLLWISFFGLWGTGTVMQMNAAQVYRSKNYGVFDGSRNSLNVALIGVGSATGRMFSGVVDLKLSEWRKEGRTQMLTTTFLPVGAVLLFAAYLLFAVIPVEAIILPFLLGSMGTGMGWGLGVLTIRILYSEDIGKHYNSMFTAGFVCTIALNRFMFGEMYDYRARQQGTSPHCNQPSCVRDQMLILMAVNAVSAVSCVLVHLRYARFVRMSRANGTHLSSTASVPQGTDKCPEGVHEATDSEGHK